MNKKSVNLKKFGVKLDGKTDDSTAFQKAIDYVSEELGGGTITVPCSDKPLRISNVCLKPYVSIIGETMHSSYGWAERGGACVIKNYDEGRIFYTNNKSATNYITLIGLTLIGLDSINSHGIILNNSNDIIIRNCNFFKFSNEALWHKKGGTLRLDTCKIYGTGRKQGDYVTGALRIDSNDCMVNMCEIGGGFTDKELLINSAFYYGGSALMMSKCIFEGSDIGAFITGANGQFDNCRSDLNYGYGWYLNRIDDTLSPPWRNRFNLCWGHRNSKYGNGEFDNFRIEEDKKICNIQMSNIYSSSNSSDGYSHRYGIFDGGIDTKIYNYIDEGAVISKYIGNNKIL